MDAITFFKALSNPIRLDLLLLLKSQDAICVCDLTQQLAQPQSTISRHLSYLKQAELVTIERRGNWMWYSLNKDLPEWCQQVINSVDIVDRNVDINNISGNDIADINSSVSNEEV